MQPTRRLSLLSAVILLAPVAATGQAADFSVVPGPEQVPVVERVGPPVFYMKDVGDFGVNVPDAAHFPIPQTPVTKQTYMKWIEDSGHLKYVENPKHGHFAARHLLPLLAKYVDSGEEQWGRACLVGLQDYYATLQEEVKKDGWHAYFNPEPMLLGVYRRFLTEGGILDEKRDTWFRDLLLFHARTLHVWGTAQNFWRGPVHRAQSEGASRGLTALWYPDIPEAAEWRQYAAIVKDDWWKYRDYAQNDQNYSFICLLAIALRAELEGDEAVWTDPGMKPLWDRLLQEISPDGAVIPYGCNGGWNANAADRMLILELVAAHTRDGRYKYGAQKLMNYLLYQQSEYLKHYMLLGPAGTEKIALCYLFCDDSVKPVVPESGSQLLFRRETLRVRDKAAAAKYLPNLDPDPLKANIDCGLLLTDKIVPNKLVLRSGWNPGDLYVLVDLFPRHDPLNPGGIVGMTRWGSCLAMASETAARHHSGENRVLITDLAGSAPLRFNTDPELVDPFYQEVEVPAFADLKAATFTTVTVSNYNGFPVKYTRDFLFLKNRYLVSRELVEFEEGFLAEVAPVFNTQNIGPQVGPHWANTFYNRPWAWYWPQPLKNPSYDLWVYFSPRPDCRLQVVDRSTIDPNMRSVPAQLRYTWRGAAQAGQRLLFTQALIPHYPTSERNGAGGRPAVPEPAPESIRFLVDTPELTVGRFDSGPEMTEWIVANPSGAKVSQEGLETDARFVYVMVAKGEVKSVASVEGTFLTLEGKDVFRQEARGNYEK